MTTRISGIRSVRHRHRVESLAFYNCRLYSSNRSKRDVLDAFKKTNVDRALEHYDDVYGSVYQKKWPAFRLALLTSPKYVAIPNTYTGDIVKIGEYLQTLGSLDLSEIWKKYNLEVERGQESLRLMEGTEDVEKQEKMMEHIAQAKVAEELDVIYQNAPRQKLALEGDEDRSADSRILTDIKDAAGEFVSANRLKGMDDFLLESEYFSFYRDELRKDPSEMPIYADFKYTNMQTFSRLKFPTLLRPHTFEPGNPSQFPSSPLNGNTGLREYICVNGASLAPIIALDIKPGISFLDLCSGPGTKSLMTLMTNCVYEATLNDVDQGRLQRVKRLLTEFIGSTAKSESIRFTRTTAANYPSEPKFDRILADVPCLSDRVSCTISDNSIFKTTRLKERLSLIHLQKAIILSAFGALLQEPGSTVVYSTCTLSPVENDGAVGAALREAPYEGLEVDLLGLWTALKPLELAGLFYLSRTKFGVLIEPNVKSNFGPMFVSKIVYKPLTIDDVKKKLSQLE